MPEQERARPPTTNGEAAASNFDPGQRGVAPPGLTFWGTVWFWVRFWLYVKTARLRFIAVLVAVGGVIAYWDTLKAHYEKWTRPLSAVEAAASPDSEFWCPMHP